MSKCNKKKLNVKVATNTPKLNVVTTSTPKLNVAVSFDNTTKLNAVTTNTPKLNVAVSSNFNLKNTDLSLCPDIWFVSKNISYIELFSDAYIVAITKELFDYDVFQDILQLNVSKPFVDLLINIDNTEIKSNKYISDENSFNIESCSMIHCNYIDSSYFQDLYIANIVQLLN